MFATVEKLTANIIEELGLATGAGVQLYTEPQVVSGIEDAFLHLIKKRFWSHLTFISTHNVDEAGYPTTDLTSVEAVTDIAWVKVAPYTEEDTLVFYDLHPHVAGKSVGYEQIPWGEALQKERLIRIVPAGMVSEIKVRARRTPTFPRNEDIVPFDKITLKHFVTANILANDGMNPGAQQRHDALFIQRYQDLISAESRGVLQFTERSSNSFTVAED